MTDLMISEDLTSAIFTNDGKEAQSVDSVVATIRHKVEMFEADVSTKKGRDACKSFAFKVAKSKTAILALGKEAAEPHKAQIKAIKDKCDEVAEIMTQLSTTAREPLTAYEKKEADRVAELSSGVNAIRELGLHASANWDKLPLELMRLDLETLANQNNGNWQEFNDVAVKNIESATHLIKTAIERRIEHDAQQLELEQLRKEAAERKPRDAASKASTPDVKRVKMIIIPRSEYNRALGALDLAARQFQVYADLHAAKGTEQGDRKAKINQDMVDLCLNAIIPEAKEVA